MGDLRIVLIGVAGVGKSALAIRFALGQWVDEYDPTIEDSHRRQVTIDGRSQMLDIVDTAGQEAYATMQDQWFRTGDGFLLVYSVTVKASLDDTKRLRAKIARIKEGRQFPVVLVGNKCDLEEDRQLSREDGQAVATEMDAPFFETSAKTGQNVEEVFTAIVRAVRLDIATRARLSKDARRCVLL